MPTFSDIANGIAHGQTVWGTLTVKIDYYPAHVTERTIASVQGFDVDDPVTAFADLNALLIDLIKFWDLTEDDGTTMYPLVEDRLSSLPMLFRVQCLRDIIGNLRPELSASQGENPQN